MSKATEILLIRHGETQWNAKGLIQGHTNIPLNDQGIKQAEELAEKLLLTHPEITAIYSSDLDRAHATALITAERLNLSVKSKHPHLREIKYGEAEGIGHDEKRARFSEKEKYLNETYLDRKERWKHASVPGAETYAQVLERGQKVICEIAKSHPGEKIAIFSHGRLIRLLIEDYLDTMIPLQLTNCEVVHFLYRDDKLHFLKREN